MLMIDVQTSSARLSLQDIRSGGKRYVSNPIAFCEFIKGLSVTPELLLDARLQSPAGASSRFAFFQLFLHEILPLYYNVRHLEALGGRFALRLTGIGDYTVTAFNRRVLTFKGLPACEKTGVPVIDAEIRPEVFMALCNELLANLSEAVLRHLPPSGTPQRTSPASPIRRSSPADLVLQS